MDLELGNGSRIVSVPSHEENVRGFTADLAILDEAAMIDDVVFDAVSPMLAVRKGTLIALSTPHGKRGTFFRIWTEGDGAWTRFMAKATECPRLSPEYLEKERAKMGDIMFAQEYLCEFNETENAVFASDDIHALVDDAVRPLFEPVASDEVKPLVFEFAGAGVAR